jgi:GT2 family glycosyltransferase
MREKGDMNKEASSGPLAFELKPKVDLSIIIVNYNTRLLLQKCIQSIYDTARDVSLEILVVDNGSSDHSVEMIQTQFPEVKLIANSEDLGFSRSANLALARGRGDCFLVAHADITFMPEALQRMLSFLKKHPQVGLVGCKLLYPDGSYNDYCRMKRLSPCREMVTFLYFPLRKIMTILPWLDKKFPFICKKIKSSADSIYWNHDHTTESQIIWNACMMFKKEVLQAIGNFCEDFFIWFADMDWCYRATRAGWKAYYLAGAKVIHYERQSGHFLDSKLVDYKINWLATRDHTNADKYRLLRRHHCSLFLHFMKGMDTASLWATRMKLILLKMFLSFRKKQYQGHGKGNGPESTRVKTNSGSGN